ncbi:MAG TPA: polyprenyl synthetase family protein [Gemmataceae bacterium]|nr:polyprenyl synthetase family protein [Gemmataceae bacterium]
MLNPAQVNGSRTAKLAALPASLVAGDLREVERIFDDALAPFRGRFAPIVNHLKHYRGKRLRPVLLLLAGHACGTVSRVHHVLAAVVEMVHTATLVHDDVLDEADTRRHVRTVNAGWGSKTSLLLGDMLFSAAFRLCSTVDARACEWVGDATNRVCAGELFQVSRAGDLGIGEDEYFEIVAGKTGALIECCTRLGAHYAGAAPDVVECLAEFGRELGVAFQIADDVLDLTGNVHTTGKTLGTDVGQQKLTLPLIRTLAGLPSAEAERMRGAIRRGAVADVTDALAAAGATASAEAEARRIAARARRSLGVLPATRYREALEQISDWAVNRDR